MKRCLVTGGTGFVGSHLVDGLLKKRQAVTCTIRPTSDTRWLKGIGAQLVPCRLDNPDDLAKALVGVNTVYHVAGAIAARNADEFMATNAGLTRSLIDACSLLAEPPRFVYISSLAAAGPSRPGEPRTETMPETPVSDYGRSKLAAEEIVRGYSDRLETVIIRPPVVYGPRDPAMLSVFKLAKSPLRPGVGSDRPLSLVYVDDLVLGIVLAGDSTVAAGGTYFMAHPEPLTTRQLGDMLAGILGSRGITIPVPDLAVKAAAAAG
ncbi:MAG TPA: NAD-dependent epimerase/dehydratase family protein, partial [Dehalococcoidia bacterium]|nr:NAD-dependent epimerase/dehydratase family protein [Dehalococcoidia bacterium]